MDNEIKIIKFSNKSKKDRAYLKEFVNFHWTHYKNEPKYIPLLDYEYLGNPLVGIKGLFEPTNLFFQQNKACFFLAYRNKKIIGRCMAFTNEGHNKHWNDNVGFFGHFECINNHETAHLLLDHSKKWLLENEKTEMRGPHNFPINEATPGLMIEGYQTRPIIYYHYSYPYYKELLNSYGLNPIKYVRSWEYKINDDNVSEKFGRLTQKIIERYHITLETWSERPYHVRKKEMFKVYNQAWENNFSFVPFTFDEFSKLLDDLKFILIEKLFTFVYVKGELAAFIGLVPNVNEFMNSPKNSPKLEIIRALKILFSKSKTKGVRVAYLGILKKFRKLGLDAVMLWYQDQMSKDMNFEYSDLGWILEDNKEITRLIERFSITKSKRYAIFEKNIGSPCTM